MKRALWAAGWCACLGLSACEPQGARFLADIPWREQGQWFIADFHTHTRYSDGAKSPRELAALARQGGCQILAITDHGDRLVQSLSPAFFTDLAAARQAEPKLTLFAGLEWNVPEYRGREHVGVLMGSDRAEALGEFRRRFEAEGAKTAEALAWLKAQAGDSPPILIYNHPSRADKDAGENTKDLAAWTAGYPGFRLIEGGPGHQAGDPAKAYTGLKPMVAGWDAAVAELGGDWDRFLDQGLDLHGALASSDYHNPRMDHPPCVFGRSHVLAAGRTEREILAALRAGSFWGEQGRLLKSLDVRLVAKGLPGPAIPGTRIAASAEAPLHLHVAAQPEASWPLDVEIIGNGVDGKPAVQKTGRLTAKLPEFFWQPPPLKPGADGRSAYFRLRLSGLDAEGQKRVAYSNAIRVLIE